MTFQTISADKLETGMTVKTPEGDLKVMGMDLSDSRVYVTLQSRLGDLQWFFGREQQVQAA